MKELVTTPASKVAEGRTELDLFESGKAYYADGLYSLARDAFDALVLNFPNSPYREFAEIKVADSDFDQRKYAEAAVGYEQFLKDHPGSPSSGYALLQQARSHRLAYGGPGRDPAPLVRAREASERLLAQFPGSQYEPAARELRLDVLEQLTEHERIVRDFYVKQNRQQAAAVRDEIVQNRWEPLLAEERGALQQQVEAAAAEPRLQRGPVQPPARPSAPVMAPAGSVVVRKLECRDAEIVLHLSAAVDLAAEGSRIEPEDGKITFGLPGVSPISNDFECSRNGTVTAEEHGMIAVRTSRPALLFTMSRPDRVIIQFQ